VSWLFGKDLRRSDGWRTATFKSRTGFQAAISRPDADLLLHRGTGGFVTGPHCCQQFASHCGAETGDRTIPIVFSVVNDPLGQGFITNQARPGGSITGFTFVDFPMIRKWLELLKEIAPGVTLLVGFWIRGRGLGHRHHRRPVWQTDKAGLVISAQQSVLAIQNAPL
jgi:hypothetical protein